MLDQFADAIVANLFWAKRSCGVAKDRLTDTSYFDPHFPAKS
jgi:hypothetical protein